MAATPEMLQFVSAHLDRVCKLMAKDEAVLALCVMAHESGWGSDTAMIANSNLYGIKPTKSQPRDPTRPWIRYFNSLEEADGAFRYLLQRSSHYTRYRNVRRVLRTEATYLIETVALMIPVFGVVYGPSVRDVTYSDYGTQTWFWIEDMEQILLYNMKVVLDLMSKDDFPSFHKESFYKLPPLQKE